MKKGEKLNKQSVVIMQKMLEEKDHKIAVLERALKLACDWFRQTGFLGDQTETEYFIKQAEKELKDE